MSASPGHQPQLRQDDRCSQCSDQFVGFIEGYDQLCRGVYHLTAPQSEVDAVLVTHEVLVSPRLRHPALVHHQDLVTVHHSAQSGQQNECLGL